MATQNGTKLYSGGNPNPVLVKAATDYTIVPGETAIDVGDTSIARTITLPALQAVEVAQTILIKDTSGAANVNAITIAAAGADLIDGAASVTIRQAYGSVSLYSTGLNWRVRNTNIANLQKVTQAIAYTDLTDAVSGEAQVLNVGSVLPTGAIIVGHEVVLTTQFTGGSVSACKMDLGVSGDTQSLCNQFDIKGSTASGKKYAPGYEHGSLHGTHCTGQYGGLQLIATVTPTADSLSHLTAGALTINVWYLQG